MKFVYFDLISLFLFSRIQLIIKSPRYTQGDFMFLYQFLCRRMRQRRCRRRQPQILVHTITFEQFFYFFHFWHDCWPWPVDYLIRFSSIFVLTLTWIFQGQIWNLLYLNRKWSDCHETKSKHIDWTLGLKCNHCVWPWPRAWPWVFKVKYRICYISAKNSSIATKRKANISIELQGLKCDHQARPWPWPWPWVFKVKYGISYILAKSGPIVTKRKGNILIELQASNVTNGFDFWPWPWHLNFEGQIWPWLLTTHITLTLDFHG